MTESAADPVDAEHLRALAPSAGDLEALAVAVATTTADVLASLAPEFPDAAAVEIESATASFRDLTPAGIAADDAAHGRFDALRFRSPGRSPGERLLSAHLLAGFASDVIIAVGAASEQERERERLTQQVDWSAPQEHLRAAIEAAFAADPLLDDRLAMWGRRIAGDAAVWVRELCGVAPGIDPDTVRPGSGHALEAVTRILFAQHSRRMNALGLPA